MKCDAQTLRRDVQNNKDEKFMAIGKEERFLNMELGKKFMFPVLGTDFFTLPE